MKNLIFAVLIAFLFLSPVLRTEAQSGTDKSSSSNSGTNTGTSTSSSSSNAFDTTGFPQWAKDFRRWDIIAFGVFPFALFFTTVATDLVRWNDANGMSMSDRRYAPWPFKSAGAAELTSREFGRTILFAAGLSIVLAFTDLIIVKMKRRKAAKIEPPSKGSYTVENIQYGDDATEEDLNITDDDTEQDWHSDDMNTIAPGGPPVE